VTAADTGVLSANALPHFLRETPNKGCVSQCHIRALPFKWIRALIRCWVDRVPYDESRYLAALQKAPFPNPQIRRAITFTICLRSASGRELDRSLWTRPNPWGRFLLFEIAFEQLKERMVSGGRIGSNCFEGKKERRCWNRNIVGSAPNTEVLEEDSSLRIQRRPFHVDQQLREVIVNVDDA